MSDQALNIFVTAIVSVLGTGGLAKGFQYLSDRRKQTIEGRKEQQAQTIAGSQAYITTLEKRIDKQDARIDKMVEEYEARLVAKDAIIDGLQEQVTALTIKSAAQDTTIKGLQAQITANKI